MTEHTESRSPLGQEELPWNVSWQTGPSLKVGDVICATMVLPLNWWQRFLLFWFGIEPEPEVVSMTYEVTHDLSSSDAKQSGSPT